MAEENVIMRKCPQCGGVIVKKIAWDIEACESCGWIWNVGKEIEDAEKDMDQIKNT